MAGNHSSGTGGVLGSSELNRDTAGLQGTYGWAVQSGAVTFSTGLTFNVAAVATADYKVAGVNGASYAGGTVVLTAQDATNPRVDIIVITVAGAVSAVAGTPAALTTTGGPGPATPTAAQLEIARIYVPASGGLLSASSITDRRVSLPDGAVTLTTTGDIIYASAAHTAARLGIGSSAQLLTVSGGLPVWASPAAAGATDYQAFTGSGTWTKPAGATASSQTLVRAWGAGGGGGGGFGAAVSNSRRGGGSGGAAGLNEMWMLTSLLGGTETVTIGAAGTSGAAASTGGAGGNTLFGSYVSSYGGGGGSGAGAATNSRAGGGGGALGAGQSGAGATNGVGGLPASIDQDQTLTFGSGFGGETGGVASGTGMNGGGNADYGGGGGAEGGNAANGGGTGGSSRMGGGGGGGGGSVDSTNPGGYGVAGAGGSSNSGVSGTGAAGGANGGSAGIAGTTGIGTMWGGSGGGGGGGNNAGTGGAGGVGGAKGGGGGGGGGGTSTGGAGGAGGIGWIEVITFI